VTDIADATFQTTPTKRPTRKDASASFMATLAAGPRPAKQSSTEPISSSESLEELLARTLFKRADVHEDNTAFAAENLKLGDIPLPPEDPTSDDETERRLRKRERKLMKAHGISNASIQAPFPTVHRQLGVIPDINSFTIPKKPRTRPDSTVNDEEKRAQLKKLPAYRAADLLTDNVRIEDRRQLADKRRRDRDGPKTSRISLEGLRLTEQTLKSAHYNNERLAKEETKSRKRPAPTTSCPVSTEEETEDPQRMIQRMIAD
jgi:hypothetical protein